MVSVLQVFALDLKQYIDKETAWLAPNRKYYSSESAYKRIKRKQVNARYYRKKKRLEKEHEMAEKKSNAKKRLSEAENIAYKQCVQCLYDWMGYPTNAQMPKFVYGLLKQWHTTNNYSYEVILETMYFVDDMVKNAIFVKCFNSDSSQLKYITAIIRDHLNDGLKQFARKQRDIQAAREASISAIDMPSDEELLNIGVKNANKDVSKIKETLATVIGEDVFK